MNSRPNENLIGIVVPRNKSIHITSYMEPDYLKKITETSNVIIGYSNFIESDSKIEGTVESISEIATPTVNNVHQQPASRNLIKILITPKLTKDKIEETLHLGSEITIYYQTKKFRIVDKISDYISNKLLSERQ